MFVQQSPEQEIASLKCIPDRFKMLGYLNMVVVLEVEKVLLDIFYASLQKSDRHAEDRRTFYPQRVIISLGFVHRSNKVTVSCVSL